METRNVASQHIPIWVGVGIRKSNHGSLDTRTGEHWANDLEHGLVDRCHAHVRARHRLSEHALVDENAHVFGSIFAALLPGGGLVRLSAGIDRTLLLDVIRSVSTVLEESRS